MGNDTDIVDAIFAVELDSNSSSEVRSIESNWVESFPLSEINGVESAANYVIGLGHCGWNEYMRDLRDKVSRDVSPSEKPHSSQLPYFPFSIRRAANQQPLNCVGRMASVYILNKRLGFEQDIRIVVEKSRENPGRGEHMSYYLNTSRGKKFLSRRDHGNSAEDLPITMLPSVYALQKAIAYSSISEYCSNKEELEKKAVRYARRAEEFNRSGSSYVDSLVETIIEDAKRHGVI